MQITRIILQSGRDESVRRLHPWVFSGAIATIEGNPFDGEVVAVYSKERDYLASGHFHDGSIAVRIFSFNQDSPNPVIPDVTYWTEKLRRIRIIRSAVLPPRTDCYRLVHAEGDGCSGLIIDMYNGVAVLQAHSIGMHRECELIIEALKNLFGDELKAVYDKSAETLPSDYGASVQNAFRYGWVEIPHVVHENGHFFLVDWITGQKTGFFLDQRDNRQLLTHYVAGKRILNAFCYSGGFSIYALSAGATLVHSVDVSQKAIELVNRNVAANFGQTRDGIDGRHEAFGEDVMHYLRAHDHQYDLIVLDPPAFAKNLSARHRAVQGYKRLNAEGLRRLASGGILVTFSCSQVIDQKLFYNTIVAAAIEAGRQVRVLHHLSQPADHPVNLFHPEGSYLKGLVLWVD